MPTPAAALRELAASLREEGTVISPHVREPDGIEAALGELAAAGERARREPFTYALIVESVREGYLLHYGRGRLVVDADRDLGLLAGDYLYALGLDRLAGLGNLEAVRELSDLISLCAQVHGEDEHASPPAPPALSGLWLACTVAVGGGADARHERAKAALRTGDSGAAGMLAAAAAERGRELGLDRELGRAADSINCA